MVASLTGWDRKRESSQTTVAPTPPDIVEREPRLPTHDEIQHRAFEIYERNGRQDGQAQEHWMEAERELMQECRLEEQDMALNSRLQQRTPSGEL